MGFDEYVFEILFGKYQKSKKNKINKKRVGSSYLINNERRLQIVAQLLSEKSISILATDEWGGYENDTLFLPERIQIFDTEDKNTMAYLFRTVYASEIYKKKEIIKKSVIVHEIDKPSQSSLFHFKNKSEQKIRFTDLINFSKTSILENEKNIFKNYPYMQTLRVQFGEWLGEDPLTSSKFCLTDPSVSTFSLWGLVPIETERERDNSQFILKQDQNKINNNLRKDLEIKTKAQAQIVKLQKDQENPLVHVFEKVNTIENYEGGNKQQDSSDQGEEHEDALNEIVLSHVIRTQERAGTIVKSDAIIEGANIQIENYSANTNQVSIYPEWNFREQKYRENWCKVYHQIAIISDVITKVEYSQRLAEELKNQLESLYNSYQWQGRLKDGDEFDIQSLIDFQVDRRRKQNGSERIYAKKNKKIQDVGILILVDQSLSTDSWVINQRVMDVLKTSLTTFLHALKDFHNSVSIASFYSLTRHKIIYNEIKSFTDNWSNVDSKIASLSPMGYTRIGPILRHSMSQLVSTDYKHKIIFLLSDAKPTDYDHYEGLYGRHDVRKSILELNKENIHTKVFALTDKKSPYYIDMFGQGQFEYLTSPKNLTKHIFDTFYRVLKI